MPFTVLTIMFYWLAGLATLNEGQVLTTGIGGGTACPAYCLTYPTASCIAELPPTVDACAQAQALGANNLTANLQCMQNAEQIMELPSACTVCGCAATSLTPIPLGTPI